MPSLSIPSPVGQLTIDEMDDAIVAIRWADAPSGNGSALLTEAAHQLAAYFDGQLSRFDLPLAPAGSPFAVRVWSAMQDIPYGETRCYGDLAMAVGQRGFVKTQTQPLDLGFFLFCDLDGGGEDADVSRVVVALFFLDPD